MSPQIEQASIRFCTELHRIEQH